MGGYSSGRRNGGPVVEDGWKLDLAHCIRKGLIRPGSYAAGTMQWTLTRTDEVKAEISYEANFVDPADAWMRLTYTKTAHATGAKMHEDYRVRLETTRPNFGGCAGGSFARSLGVSSGCSISLAGAARCSPVGRHQGWRIARNGPRPRIGPWSGRPTRERSSGLLIRTCWTCLTARGRSGCGTGRTGGS